MRPLILAFVLAGCGSMSNGDPAPTPKAGPGASADDCVRACVQSRQMEARAADDIEADCRKECAASGR